MKSHYDFWGITQYLYHDSFLLHSSVPQIRDESGAKIRIEGTSPQERIITVDGPTDSIFKVKLWSWLAGYAHCVAGVHIDLQDT